MLTVEGSEGGMGEGGGCGRLEDFSESKITIGNKFVVKKKKSWRAKDCFRDVKAALLVGVDSSYAARTKRWAIFSAFILQLGNNYIQDSTCVLEEL